MSATVTTSEPKPDHFASALKKLRIGLNYDPGTYRGAPDQRRIPELTPDEALALQQQLAEAESRNAQLAGEVEELRKDAQSWRALWNCARIKLVGYAGLHEDSPNFNTPFGHIGLEFWTQHGCSGDAQDIEGREWFGRFMTKARAALAREQGGGK